MYKSFLFAAGVAALMTSAAWTADANPAVKTSSVVSAENLSLAADEKIAKLEKSLATPEEYEKAKKYLSRDAGMIAVFAQAIAEHDQAVDWKASAADVRDAAIKLAGAESQGEAAQFLQDVKVARGGEAMGAEAQKNWAELIDFGAMMHEITLRNRSVGRTARKMRRKVDEETREEAARDVEIMALIGVVIAANTDFAGDDEEMKEWKRYSHNQRDSGMAAAAAFRQGDADALKTAYANFRKSCSECHKAFRD